MAQTIHYFINTMNISNSRMLYKLKFGDTDNYKNIGTTVNDWNKHQIEVGPPLS